MKGENVPGPSTPADMKIDEDDDEEDDEDEEMEEVS